MASYDVRLLDGGSDAGSDRIEALGDELALASARQWAKGGDWDHPGSVELVVGRDGLEIGRESVSVG